MDPESLLVDLDADQRRAVTSESSMVAVIAGAGSGKTRVLTRRVAHRIASESALARHTLVLTFTREAAGELRRRLGALGLRDRIEAGTFHSVALGLLRQRWSDTGRAPKTIIDDRRRIVTGLLGAGAGDRASMVLDEIDWASARGLDAAGYEHEVRSRRRRSPVAARIPTLLEAYAADKRRRGVLDLDDLLSVAAQELSRDGDFARATRWRFRHLLVDEAQDLTPLQQRLLDVLRADGNDLFLVGDPAQSIYGFNGSDPGLLLEVHERFPGIEVIRLPVNHRCTPQIVDAGVHVLSHAGIDEPLVSARPDGPGLSLLGFGDEHAEAAAIADRISRLDPGELRRGRVAVLARTHQHCRTIEQALRAASISVRGRGLSGDTPGRRALDAARRCSSATALRSWAHDLLDGGAEVIAAAMGAETREGEVTAASVAAAALEFLREQSDGDGQAFSGWVTANDPFGLRDQAGVEVLTFHAAKGREWPWVWVAGVETGSVPHRSATSTAAAAEEARLLYVAITRSIEVCIVSSAAQRNGYRRSPSPFLTGYVVDTPEVSGPPTDLITSAPKVSDAQRLRAALNAWRDRAARRAGVTPDQICSDHSLSAIALRRPADAGELDEVTRWGAITSRRFFDEIAETISAVEVDEDRGMVTR
ncbi:MAG: ATP-dependent helicase [Ilumatobacteraceae bacterium]